MFNIKRFLSVMTCALVLCSAMSACGDKDKDKGNSDGFTISEVTPSENSSAPSGNSEVNSAPDAADREYEETLGVIGEEYDYYGIKYTVNKVSELEVEQYPGGKVLLVDVSLTNNSEYDQTAGIYINFDVFVDGEGKTSDFITAQVMTIVTRYFIAQGIDCSVFGTGEAPIVKPGETVTGVLPLAITSDIVDFETITLSFLPDIEAGSYNNITIDITPEDIVPYN